MSDQCSLQFPYEEERSTPQLLRQRRLPLTHHLPGIANVVGLLSSFSQLVYVPGQGWVHRDCDNLAAQREAALANNAILQVNDKMKHLIKGREDAVSQWPPPDFEKQWSSSLLKEIMWDFQFCKSILSALHQKHSLLSTLPPSCNSFQRPTCLKSLSH